MRRAVALCGGLALVAGLVALPSGAQEPRGRTKAAPPSSGAEPGHVAAPPGVRVPDYFNKVEPPLRPEQRARIYEIQARALRDSEGVLTPAQRSSLQRLREQGGERRAGAPTAEKGVTPAPPESVPAKVVPTRKGETRKKGG